VVAIIIHGNQPTLRELCCARQANLGSIHLLIFRKLILQVREKKAQTDLGVEGRNGKTATPQPTTTDLDLILGQGQPARAREARSDDVTERPRER